MTGPVVVPDEQDARFLHEFSVRWLEAWNSHDTERLFELLDPEVLWEDLVFWPEPLRGIDAMRPYMAEIWKAMPDVAWTEIERFFSPDGRRGLVLFEQTGHGPARLGADREFRTHGCDIFLEFRDGRLSHYRSAYDIVGMLEQLGALPPRGDRSGGAYVMSLLGAGRPS